MKLIIATGNSRKEKQWRNRDMTWAEFLAKVSSTYRTSETVAEYRQLSKAKQDKLKDVGGFVGGSLKGGRRKAGCVEHRSLLTLDMDYAELKVWDFIVLLNDYSNNKLRRSKPIPQRKKGSLAAFAGLTALMLPSLPFLVTFTTPALCRIDTPIAVVRPSVVS